MTHHDLTIIVWAWIVFTAQWLYMRCNYRKIDRRGIKLYDALTSGDAALLTGQMLDTWALRKHLPPRHDKEPDAQYRARLRFFTFQWGYKLS